MTEQRKDILDMLASGKITAEEAEQLIAALERDQAPTVAGHDARPKAKLKYLRVMVDATDNGEPAGSTSGCHCNCCEPAYGWPRWSRRRHWSRPTPNSATRACRST